MPCDKCHSEGHDTINHMKEYMRAYQYRYKANKVAYRRGAYKKTDTVIEEKVNKIFDKSLK